jgi:hypothetical protein
MDRLTFQLNSARKDVRFDLEDMSKKNSRITPTKSRGPIENNAVVGNFGGTTSNFVENENEDCYRMTRPAKSRTTYFGMEYN